MSSPFLPITTPGRAEKMVMRAFLAGRSISTRETAAFFSLVLQVFTHLDVFGQHAGEVTVASRTSG
jgi:hypothetical protein